MGRSPTAAELRRAAKMIDVSVPTMSLVVLIRKSAAHYNSRNPGKHVDPAAVAADPRLFARLAVNWLRHECSSYDHNRDLLRQLASRQDRDEVGAMIKGRTLAAIARTYPQLAEEARRQAERTDQKVDGGPRGRQKARR